LKRDRRAGLYPGVEWLDLPELGLFDAPAQTPSPAPPTGGSSFIPEDFDLVGLDADGDLEPYVPPGSSTYLGVDAHVSAFSHFMEEAFWEGDAEEAPDVPEERPDLPREEFDARRSEIWDALDQPDSENTTNVVNALCAMSDDDRRDALASLSDNDFNAMLENLPPEEQERLGELAGATDNQQRRLQLWAAGERGELGRDERNLGLLPTTDRSEDDVKLLERASAAARDGQVEIDDERDHALDELEKGHLTQDEQKLLVDELIARKEKEREIEKQFNVNLTNDNDDGEIDLSNKKKMPRPRASWSIEELEQMQVVLDRMPAHAIEENARLGEIRRSVADYDLDPTTEKWVKSSSSGETTDNEIQIFNRAANGTNDHDGDSSDLAGIHEITSLQETVAHEVAHVLIHTEQVDIDLVTDKANWRSERTSPDIERKLEESKKSKTGAASDGRTYVKDENGNITSADAALMPRSNEHTKGNEKGDIDTWSYARTAEDEYFAEMHAKAIIAPELLYEDLIDGPQQRLKDLQDRGAPRAEIDEAKRIADKMAEQHAAMRTKVMKVDPAVEEANVEALKARADQLGLDDVAKEMLIEDYKKEAAKAMTPEQLEVAFNSYDADVESYY
jgi:hypothetical protein